MSHGGGCSPRASLPSGQSQISLNNVACSSLPGQGQERDSVWMKNAWLSTWCRKIRCSCKLSLKSPGSKSSKNEHIDLGSQLGTSASFLFRVLCPRNIGYFRWIMWFPSDASTMWSSLALPCTLFQEHPSCHPTPVSTCWTYPSYCLSCLSYFISFPFLSWFYRSLSPLIVPHLTCTFNLTKLKATQKFVFLQVIDLFFLKLWSLLSNSFAIVSWFSVFIFFIFLTQQIRHSYNYFIPLMLI